MGEARYRKKNDPDFGTVRKASPHAAAPSPSPAALPAGQVPLLNKGERGLIISPPMELNLNANQFSARGGFDLQALRADLLFWDKLVFPQTGFVYNAPEIEYLQRSGILSCPRFPMSGGELAKSVYGAHVSGFQFLDAREPGAWAVGQGPNSIKLWGDGAGSVEGRGALLKLLSAVPIPDASVALEDVLEFRERRRDEMRALRSQIEEFYLDVVSVEDQGAALLRYSERIDQACVDVLRVGRERNFRMRLSDWTVSIDLFEIIKASA